MRQIKHFVGREDTFLARNVRNDRPASCRNGDVRRCVFLATHHNGIRIFYGCRAFDDRNAGILEQTGINTVEPFYFCILVGNKRWPVEVDSVQRHVPAITRCIFQLIFDMSAVDEQFLGHAANVNAGATKIAGFHYRNPGAAAGRHARKAHATGTGTNNYQIIILAVRHNVSCCL